MKTYEPDYRTTERVLVQPEGFSLPAMEAGYTNRKAKRWFAKARRRERLRDIKTGKAYAATGRRLLAADGVNLLPFQRAWIELEAATAIRRGDMVAVTADGLAVPASLMTSGGSPTPPQGEN